MVPTPALAFLAGDGDVDAGIMVSASHNPAEDNGLKVLDADGLKLDDTIEDELEQLIWRTDELAGVAPEQLGVVRRRAGPDRPLRRPPRRFGPPHRRVRAPDRRGLRERLGLLVAGADPRRHGRDRSRCIHDAPDGLNINLDCGATAPAALAARVVAAGADLGFALDGDADRLVAVDAAGQVVDGDRVLGVLALERLSRPGADGADPAIGTLVVSVLSNGGLQAAVEGAGGTVVRTPVGDKYILEGMQVSGAGLGGEKSGHVIVREHTTSRRRTRHRAGAAAASSRRAGKTPRGARRADPAPARRSSGRFGFDTRSSGRATRSSGGPIAEAEARLGTGGRVLVRPSGTEPALRVMIEGEDAEVVRELADALCRRSRSNDYTDRPDHGRSIEQRVRNRRVYRAA